MRKFLIMTAAALVCSPAIVMPASAQTGSTAQPQQQQQQQQTAKPAKDPNEVICERQEEIGSRLASTKICKTRAEWAEERRVSRMDVEKVQTQRDMSH
jgi:hypothetical protein